MNPNDPLFYKAQADEQEAKSRRGLDHELQAISGILRLLDDVSETSKARIIGYLAHRFGVSYTTLGDNPCV